MSFLLTTLDEKHAIDIDRASRTHGWVFYKGPDGQWVTLREATAEEMSDARLEASKRVNRLARGAL